MRKFLLEIVTNHGFYYAGNINADSWQDADLSAFYILSGLKNDGFYEIKDVQVLDVYENAHQYIHMAIEDIKLLYHLDYYKLKFKDKDLDKIKSLIQYFCSLEDYDKCNTLHQFISI